jgi:DNA-directed RNA polymerase sigma subunit (sigma70/sigma32)
VLGSLIAWTAWKMQKILIDTQKHDIEQIATRFPRDVQIYSEMMEPEAGLQKAIDRQSDTELILWVKNSQGQIQAKSMSLESLSSSLANKLIDFPIISVKPTVYKVGQVYFVLAATPLRVKDKSLGKLFLAQDITNEKAMIDSMVRSLALIGFLTIALMTLAIAFYINYSLKR